MWQPPERPEQFEQHQQRYGSVEGQQQWQPPAPPGQEETPGSENIQWTSPREWYNEAQEPMTTERLQQENPKEEDDFGEFPKETAEAVNGLIYLGFLEDNFTFCGHKFRIKTLRGDEELMAYRLAQEYQDSVGGWAKALTWAHVALCLVSVDRDENFCPPIGPVNDKYQDYALRRWIYVTENWYYPTAEYVFRRYTDLMERQSDSIDYVQDLSTRSRMQSTPYADSLTDRGSSQQEIMEHLDF